MTAIVTQGDAANLLLPDSCVDTVICSPPYFGLRSYQDGGEHYAGQVGDEATPTEYLDALIACTREWMRVLKPGGSIFVNLGDKYSGSGATSNNNGTGSSTLGHHKGGGGPHAEKLSQIKAPRVNYDVPTKSLTGLPWRYAIRCIDELGLILRAEIVWSKPNGLPESVTDRVRRSHEQVFHFVKQPRYYSAVDEVREESAPDHRRTVAPKVTQAPGQPAVLMDRALRNPLGKLPGSVWTIPTAPLKVPDHLGIDHFAAYPPELVRRIVLGWSPREVCTACGEGRRPVAHETGRIVSSYDAPELGGTATTSHRDGNGNAVRLRAANGHNLMKREKVLTGYACACPDTNAPATPGVVLDPFGGTGTTALVASAYGRVGISVDLSADYCRLAQWRTNDPGERARVLGVDKPPVQVDGQLGLFEGVEPIAKPSRGGLASSEKLGRNCRECGYRTQYAGPTCDKCGAERGAA